MALVLVMAQAGAALGGPPSLPPSATQPALTAVRRRARSCGPGDSLWTVAERLVPDDDPRPVVDALAEARHGTVLVPGETIAWDG